MKNSLIISLLIFSICFPIKGQQAWKITSIDNIALKPETADLSDDLEKILDFSIGKEKINVWGNGPSNIAVYPDEILPTFFKRTLQFYDLSLEDGIFEWVFTGDKGGVTVRISKDEVQLTQRYYDSFGFNEVDPEKNVIKAERFPQKQFVENKVKYSGRIHSVSLETTSDLMISLALNNETVFKLPCLIDLTHHQLKYSGTKGAVAGTVFNPRKKIVQLTVNPEIRFQEIIGFGGIMSPSAYWSLNNNGKEKWWKLVKDYNLLIQREYPIGSRLKTDYSNWDDQSYIVPHYYGDNFPNGEITDFDYIKKIRELGGIVIFEFWNLPDFMYENGKLNTLKYAETIVNYCKTSVKRTGKAPEIVGIQNEKTQTPEDWRDMTLNLRQQLDANGFKNVKIHSHNASFLKDGIRAMKGFRNYPGVWEKLDYTASNLYDYQAVIFSPNDYDQTIEEFNSVAGNKPFLSTEMCVNSSKLQTDAYKIAFSYGMLYHKNMAMLNSSALIYCWTLLDYTQPSFASSRTLFTLDHTNSMQPIASGFQLRTYGAFSRHIKSGMKRVAVHQDNDSLLATAYTSNGKNTLVILNPSNNTIEVKVQWRNAGFTKMERTSATCNNELSEIPGTLIIQGGEIITLF